MAERHVIRLKGNFLFPVVLPILAIFFDTDTNIDTTAHIFLASVYDLLKNTKLLEISFASA